MNRNTAISLIAIAASAPAKVAAQTMSMPASAPVSAPVPTAAEAPFIARLQREIPARYASVAAARGAGYFQYTPEDKTGAISYVNLNVWNSVDLAVPNQLWYDVNGRLLGVDYTVLMDQSPTPPPTLFGYAIDPSRWKRRAAHMHWGFIAADGTLKLGGMAVQKFKDAGGDPNTTVPDVPANKAALVAAGIPGLTAAEQVKFVFLHPAMWDLVVWVVPNPDGAWADANPDVHPSQKTSGAM